MKFKIRSQNRANLKTTYVKTIFGWHCSMNKKTAGLKVKGITREIECVYTLAGQLSSLGEQSCDVEGRRTSSQDLMEHGLQRSLSYCSRENYRDREHTEWSKKERTKGEGRKQSKNNNNNNNKKLTLKSESARKTLSSLNALVTLSACLFSHWWAVRKSARFLWKDECLSASVPPTCHISLEMSLIGAEISPYDINIKEIRPISWLVIQKMYWLVDFAHPNYLSKYWIIKGPILSKLKFPGFFHDNRDLGAM